MVSIFHHETALQRHYGILEALALGEDEMPDVKDETLPDEEGLARYLFLLVNWSLLKSPNPYLFLSNGNY